MNVNISNNIQNKSNHIRKWLPIMLIILAGFILRMTFLFVQGNANNPESCSILKGCYWSGVCSEIGCTSFL